MPGQDPSHWLHRLTSVEWLAAAKTELVLSDQALARRAVRAGITHARRSAGMAVNAVLAQEEVPRWGRSYMEHVVALVDEPAAPEPVRAAARLLRETPPVAPELIQLGKSDRRAIDAAATIIAWAEGVVSSA